MKKVSFKMDFENSRPNIHSVGLTASGRSAWVFLEHRGVMFGGKVSKSLAKSLIKIEKSH